MVGEYELYAAIVESGSLSAAGRVLGLSPAMVSKRLARLEERLGAQLIVRSTRRFAVTPAGQRFYQDTKAVVADARAAEARAAGLQHGPAGRLKIAAPTSFGRLHIAPLLGEFMTIHPAIDVSISLSDAFVDLLAEDFDVAIRISAGLDDALDAVRLGPNQRVLCAAPAYFEQRSRPRSIAQLNEHHLLAADGQMPWRLAGPEGEVQIDRRSRVATDSSEIVRELALAGAGIALRSLWDVGPELRDGRLERILEDYQGSRATALYAAWPRLRQPPGAVLAFVEFLQRRLLR